MSKKVVSIVTLVVLLLTLAATAFAIEPIDFTRGGAGTRLNVSLTISSNGKATASASVTKLGDNCSAATTVKLQRKSGGSWVTIKEKDGGRNVSFTVDLSKGNNSYRVYSTSKISGEATDSIKGTSGTKTY